jgi:nitrilase
VPNKVTVAIIQASPVHSNLEASLSRAVALIEEAVKTGAQLVAFGETWLPGYPAWFDYCPEAALWNSEKTKEVYACLRRNSVIVPSETTEILAEAARANKVSIVIGINERIESGAGNGTLYNSLLIFDETGKLVNHHRKLVPTYTERLVWGQGDGDGLKSVKTNVGRVGALVCWEHWMPLARQAMHVAGEDIHVAVFPTVHEMHQITARQYAFEGRSFVLAVGMIMRAQDFPAEFETAHLSKDNPDQIVLRGGSCIVAPDGSFVARPVFDEEKIITTELDLTMIDREKMTLDVSGHYGRPDVFDFKVRAGLR